MADVDLSAEVTALSTKLIQAIDRQADLEDQVQVLRRELDAARRERMRLEDTMKEMASKEEVAAAMGAKAAAEDRYDRLQKDTEELSARLFEDANGRVATANREAAMIARRNGQLELQLTEKDTLLENMQQQLVGLKEVLQDLTEQEEQQVLQDKRESLHVSVAQQYQQQLMGAPQAEPSDKPLGLQPSPLDRNAGISSEQTDEYFSMPSTPTQPARASEEYSLSSFVRPTLRLDLQAFTEFKSLSQHYKHVASIREQYGTPKQQAEPASPLNTPKYHLGFAGASGLLLSSASSTPDSSRLPQYTPPSLKEFRFFKRALNDDIEPTLRLDQSPNLSWLARRSLMAAIIEGTVVVEPISGINETYKFGGGDLYSHGMAGSGAETPNSAHLYAYPQGGPPVATKAPCKLCGESRTGSLLYARMHNLRIVKNSDTPAHSASNSFSGASIGGNFSGAFGITPTNSNTNDAASIASTASASATTNNNGNGSSSSSNSQTGNSNGGEDVVSSGYPLCYYCLNRVRSVCDFVAFMKSVRDGVWKIDDKDRLSQTRAWDECSKLRERMFWARLGGCFTGVPMTPIGVPRKKASMLTTATSDEYITTTLASASLEDEDGAGGSGSSSPGDATVTVVDTETTVTTTSTSAAEPNTNDDDDDDYDNKHERENRESSVPEGRERETEGHGNGAEESHASTENDLDSPNNSTNDLDSPDNSTNDLDKSAEKSLDIKEGSSEEESTFIDAYDYDSDGIEVVEVNTAEKVQIGRAETK